MSPCITAEPFVKQRQRAQQASLAYYRKAFARKPPTEEERDFVGAIADGTVMGWSFCTD